MLQILFNLHMSAAWAVPLNEHRRFLFLYNFKTKYINMTVMYVLYALKLKLCLRTYLVSNFFITHLGHQQYLAAMAFILELDTVFLWDDWTCTETVQS